MAAGLVAIIGGIERVDAAADGDGAMSWVLGSMVFWAAAWALNIRLAASRLAGHRVGRLAVPAIFGVTILVVWEGLVRGLGVPA